MPKALKSCPKSNKSPNLVTLVVNQISHWIITNSLIQWFKLYNLNLMCFLPTTMNSVNRRCNKSSPNFSKSCPKSINISFYLIAYDFQNRLKVIKYYDIQARTLKNRTIWFHWSRTTTTIRDNVSGLEPSFLNLKLNF